jgi:hypothetical protein
MRFGRVFVVERGRLSTAILPRTTVDGRPSFNVLQNHRSAGSELLFYAFDMLLILRREHLSKSGPSFRAPT